MKKLLILMTVALFLSNAVLHCAEYVRDAEGNSVDIAFGKFDEFWGFSVIVVNETEEDIRAESYGTNLEVPLHYTCYSGDTRRIHHIVSKIKICNCEIYDSQLSYDMDNVITIKKDGSIYLDYYSNYLGEEYYDGN